MTRVLHILPHEGGGGEALVDLLGRLAGYEHERIHLSADRSPLRGAPSIARSRIELRGRAQRADVLHVVGDAAAMIALPSLRRRPALVGTHGLHLLRRASGPVGAVVRARMRGVLGAAGIVVCSSQTEFDELAALDPRASLRLVPNGTPLAPADPEARNAARAALGLDAGQVAAVFLGQLEERKRPLDAVAAAERAAAAGAPLVLLLAGEGPLSGAVAERAGPAVRPLGFRSDSDALLAAADLLVLPSEREGLPMSVLEAMAHGRPVVVSDGPGNPDAAGEAGVVVPVGDVDGLAAAMARLAGDRAERARLGALGRKRVLREFSTERYLASMDALFRELA
ncbi:MAG: glycosyltransferase family 4 protein [Thermoleophilaceae bacterium]|nr:glycosyltransferase family 4 protein [Thermoleophilaceae bacterium]